MTRRLWLVRHGETTGESSIRFHGSNDVPLADAGRAQIRALAPLLHAVDFGRVLHSPQVRAVESATILAAACAIAAERMQADERLREISFGDCEGLTAEEIAVQFPDFWAARERGDAAVFPGGEPFADYAERVGAVARELAADDWQGDLLVVGHRGTVRQFLRTLLRFPADADDPFAVDLASLTVVRQDGQAAGGDALVGFELELFGALP